MMTPRETKIRRALLQALRAIPAEFILPEDVLRADAARVVLPRPTTAELDQEIDRCDIARLIIGTPTEEGTKWKLSEVGRAWLAEHP